MANTYRLYFGTSSGNLTLIDDDLADPTYTTPTIPLAYNTTYYWRIDVSDGVDTTTGDEWSFTTLSFDPPHSTYRYRIDGSLVPEGTAFDADTMYSTGENFLNIQRRLVAAANNAIWYEKVDT